MLCCWKQVSSARIWVVQEGVLRKGVFVTKSREVVIGVQQCCAFKLYFLTLHDEFVMLRTQARKCRKVLQSFSKSLKVSPSESALRTLHAGNPFPPPRRKKLSRNPFPPQKKKAQQKNPLGHPEEWVGPGRSQGRMGLAHFGAIRGQSGFSGFPGCTCTAEPPLERSLGKGMRRSRNQSRRAPFH